MSCLSRAVPVLAVVGILLSGCGHATEVPAEPSSSTRESADLPTIRFHWVESDVLVPLNSPEATIVRATYESWTLNMSYDPSRASGGAVYPGFDAAVTPKIRERAMFIRGFDKVDGTFLQGVVGRRSRGQGVVAIDICTDFRAVRYKGVGPMRPNGYTVEIRKTGSVVPPSDAAGQADRPVDSMFGSWKVADLRATPGQAALDACERWSRSLPSAVLRKIDTVTPGWPPARRID